MVTTTWKILENSNPHPQLPSDENLLSWENNFPWLALYKASACAWQGRQGRPQQHGTTLDRQKKTTFISGTRFFLHKISLSCVAGTLFLIHKRLSLAKWIPLNSHSPSIDQAFLQFHPAFTGRPKFFETRPPAIDTAGWRCRIRPQSRDRLGTRQFHGIASLEVWIVLRVFFWWCLWNLCMMYVYIYTFI